MDYKCFGIKKQRHDFARSFKMREFLVVFYVDAVFVSKVNGI